MYFELDLPNDFPLHYRRLIPNVTFAQQDYIPGTPFIRGVCLVTLREIKNEELFSDYCFIGRQSH